MRIATYAAPFSRAGPGLLVRDLQKGTDLSLQAALGVIRHVNPDVLLLTDIDYDYDGVALTMLAGILDYPYHHTRMPNTGMRTDFDLDLNGRLGDARDAQGYGRFTGDGGMAILSRIPFDPVQIRNYSDLLWRDLPERSLPTTLTPEVAAIQRLSTSGHWVVPFDTAIGRITLLAFAATPPVFDGPEDRNGLRNRDELLLWKHVLDGRYGAPPAGVVVLGNANLDPDNGQGHRAAMAAFLADPRLTDPHQGQATANWADDGPGKLRVSYVLPSATWTIHDAGVFWPSADDPARQLLGDDGLAAGVHHMVWVDISPPETWAAE